MTGTRRRVIVDTNVLISASFFPSSIPGRAARRALVEGLPIASLETLAELKRVLLKPKFEPRLPLAQRQALLHTLTGRFEVVPTTTRVTDCRDPNDNIFLQLALAGRADLILTGDADLLTFHPWRTIPILTPATYLAL